MIEYGQNGGGGKDGCADIEIRRRYRLEPGDAGTLGPHRIRSILFPENARFIRAAGTGLSRISTRKFDMAADMQPAPASAGPENNSTEKCPSRR